MALPVVTSVVRAVRAQHPHVELDISVEDQFVDLIAEGYDAGVRLSEAVDRDMVHVRLTKPARFVVVGAPEHLARHGVPQRPEDLLRHECITFRALSTGVLYAWELERGRRTWRVPVRGKVVTNDGALAITFAEAGLGLAYAFEPAVLATLAAGRLARVLEPYAATVPGHYLYYPSTARRSPALRLFVDVARQVTSTARS